MELERNGDNVWELISDSKSQPELLEDRIVVLLSVLLKDQREFIGTPTELSQKIDPDGQEGITPKKVSRLILQNVDALRKAHITAAIRRSNGKRIIQLSSADSDDTAAPEKSALSTLSTSQPRIMRKGPDNGDSSHSGGQAERLSDFVGLGAAGKPAISGRKPGPTLRRYT